MSETKKTVFDSVVSKVCPPPYHYDGEYNHKNFDIAEEGRKYFANQWVNHDRTVWENDKYWEKHLKGVLWCEKDGVKINLMKFKAHRDRGIESSEFYNDDVERWRNGKKPDDIELTSWDIDVLKDLIFRPGDKHGLYLKNYDDKNVFEDLEKRGYVTTEYVKSPFRPSDWYTVGVMTKKGKEEWQKIRNWEQIRW